MKTKILAPALALLFCYTGYSQKDKCNCFNKEEYKAFVKKEQHQTVVEGQDAELTVLLSRIHKEDIVITYTIKGETANTNTDIVVPEIKSFIIPKGETQATIHIPTVADNISELDETFTIEIMEGTTAIGKKKLNNNKLIRTRTIVDAKSNASQVEVYMDNGVIKTKPASNNIEVRNFNGISINNNNLNPGIYYIKANLENETISKTFYAIEK